MTDHPHAPDKPDGNPLTTHVSAAVEGTPHPSSIGTYVTIYLLLLALLAVTVGISYLHLGPFNLAAALVIAFIKGLLVVLYFMHLRDAPKLTWLVAAGSLVWLAILVAGLLMDYEARRVFGPDM
jgi:cytochrome c oxidase subunit IV